MVQLLTTASTQRPANPLTLPFVHLNLHFNPFGELPLKYRAKLAVIDTTPLLEHLARPRAVLQLIGEKGHGKTTHLLALKDCFSAASYVHFPEGKRPPVPEGNPLILDEAQRIPWWQRRQLFQRPVPLILGTHRDFTRQLQRMGRDVKTVQAGDKTDRQQLDKIVRQRIEFARRDPGPVPTVPLATIDQLLDQHGDDIRAIEGHLYDLFQHLERPCHVEM